jgi:hypothetical protein
MDPHEAMSSLQQATALDLLLLSTAIDHLLRNPSRILAVRQHLHLGQEVQFWNLHLRRIHHGRITKFKPEEVLMLTQTPAQYWWVTYAATQQDPNQSPPPPAPERPERADFARGDTASFEGHDLIQRVGTIIRLNQKTAAVSCDGAEWRVSCALLRCVIDR